MYRSMYDNTLTALQQKVARKKQLEAKLSELHKLRSMESAADTQIADLKAEREQLIVNG